MGGAGTGGAGTGRGGGGGAGNGGASGGTSGMAGTSGGGRGGSASGGAGRGGGGGTSGGGTSGGGTCTASKSAGRTVSGTGPHQVVVETNSDNGIKCGTIYRPADLGRNGEVPDLCLGRGGLLSGRLLEPAAMGEIASWGYFVVADGTPGGTNACAGGQTWEGVPRLHHVGHRRERQVLQRVLPEPRDDEDRGGRIFVRWIDGRECLGRSPLLRHRHHQQRADERECGSLRQDSHAVQDHERRLERHRLRERAARLRPDQLPRHSDRLFFARPAPVTEAIWVRRRGDFNRVNLAWLNWQLKGDTGATGKGFLYGSTCSSARTPAGITCRRTSSRRACRPDGDADWWREHGSRRRSRLTGVSGAKRVDQIDRSTERPPVGRPSHALERAGHPPGFRPPWRPS